VQRLDKAPSVHRSPRQTRLLIAIDTVALLFPVVSLNGVSIRVTRSLHSHVVSGECYERSIRIHPFRWLPQTAWRLSPFPCPPRCSDAFIHMHTPATPVSVILVRFSLYAGTRFVALLHPQLLQFSELLRQRNGAKNILTRLQDSARYYCHCI